MMTMDDRQPTDESASDQEIEYQMAGSFIEQFADVLLDLPPIKDIPTDTSFQAYLKELAGVIADILPLAPDPDKIGISTSITQAQQLHLATRRARNGQSLGVENDCKLGSLVTGSLLEKLAQQHQWPVRIEYGAGKDVAHAYVIVHVNEADLTDENFPFTYLTNMAYLIHFLPVEKQTLGAVSPRSDDSLVSLQQPDENGVVTLTTSASLTGGMQLFDEIYLRAVEQKKKKNR